MVPGGEVAAIVLVVAVHDAVTIEICSHHLRPLLPGVVRVGGAEPGPDGIFFLKPRVAQEFPGMVVQDQVGQISKGIPDNYGIGDVPSPSEQYGCSYEKIRSNATPMRLTA